MRRRSYSRNSSTSRPLKKRLGGPRCSRCDRLLKDPLAIERGIGPVCHKKNQDELNGQRVKVVNLAKEGMMLPAREGTCPECATAHDPDLPHNQQSLFWQYHFYRKNDRWPTWSDAMAHCTEDMRAKWTAALAERGVTV